MVEFCGEHERRGRRIDDNDKKANSLDIWVKAILFFIVLCFGVLVNFSHEVTVSVSKIAETVSAMEKKQVGALTAVAMQRQHQEKFNDQIMSEIKGLKSEVKELHRVGINH